MLISLVLVNRTSARRFLQSGAFSFGGLAPLRGLTGVLLTARCRMNFRELSGSCGRFKSSDFPPRQIQSARNIGYLEPTCPAPTPKCCARSANFISPFVERNEVTGSVFIC
jgi:hypothetical protein